MSTDFSELLAMGCPDLKSNSEGNGNVVEIMDGTRRLSVKQMTATELATTRALAEAVKAKAAMALTNSVTKQKEQFKHILNTTSPNIMSSKSATDSPQDNNMPRSRITSLPNIMHVNELVEYDFDNNEEVEIQNQLRLHEKPHLELQMQGDCVHEKTKGQPTSISEAEDMGDDLIKRSISKSSKGDETANDELDFETTEMANSIELMRQQRLEGEHNARGRRSQSPSLRPVQRIHSPSSSASNSASVSLSLNTSSRRESDVSNVDEVSKSATIVLPSPPIYPLSKTFSAPTIERRRSSLSALFPGPSPLVAPEPTLHTDPKVEETGLTMHEIQKIVDDTFEREIPAGKIAHRTKTPPPVGVKLGVNLKKVSPQRSHITVKKNDAPMLGVVLRKVEKKQVQQKSILDDDKPLYQLSIVRSDHKEYKSAPKPKPPTPLQKSATSAEVGKPNPGGILTGPQNTKHSAQVAAQQKQALLLRQQQLVKAQRPQIGVPITIQKIEGDKIIIIKKIIIPKNGKIPEQYLKVGMFCGVSWNV